MQITVTDAGVSLPSANRRTKLVLRNTGSHVAYFGWEADTSAAGATQGVPLKVDEVFALAGSDVDCPKGIRLITAAGQTTTVNFTEA